MDSNVDIKNLQIAASFITMRRYLRFKGISGIIIGLLLVIIFGVFQPHHGKYTAIVLGILMLVVGIVSIARPSPVIILMEGIIWIGLGAMIVIIGRDIMPKIVYASLTILLFTTAVERYRSFREKVPRRPTPEAMTIMDSAIRAIEVRKAPTSNNILEMNWGTMKWHIYLNEQISVLFDPSRSPISVLDRDKDLLAPRSRTGNTQMVAVTNVANKDLFLHISDEYYELYQAWKGNSAV
jgi:hypothetical protein